MSNAANFVFNELTVECVQVAIRNVAPPVFLSVFKVAVE